MDRARREREKGGYGKIRKEGEDERSARHACLAQGIFFFFLVFGGFILHNLTLPSQEAFRITYCTYLSQSRASPTPSLIGCVGSQNNKVDNHPWGTADRGGGGREGGKTTTGASVRLIPSPAPRSVPSSTLLLLFPPPPSHAA